MKFLVAFAAAPLGIAAAAVLMPPPSQAQAAPNGAQAFGMCAACHTLNKGGRAGIGPNLNGLFGRTAGTAPGYNYSPALKASGLKWDAATLDQFLAAPQKKVPGTRMPIGVADPAKRAAIIAYLKVETAK